MSMTPYETAVINQAIKFPNDYHNLEALVKLVKHVIGQRTELQTKVVELQAERDTASCKADLMEGRLEEYFKDKAGASI